MAKRLIAALLALLLLGAVPANAHSQLVDANPRPNSVLKVAPKEIVLTFNEELLSLGEKSNVITVTNSRNRAVPAANLRLTGSQLSTELRSKLTPGSYTVWWRAISSDGHPISGKYRFTVRR